MTRTGILSLAALPLLSSSASAQGIDWLTLVQDDALLVGEAATSTLDDEERDLAWGDLDQDGWVDLVAVRKKPFETQGPRVNVLFMNEAGSLVDRTAQFASSSDVPGDQGFLTTTNDRDVVLADVDGDGWLDIITATTLTPNGAKHRSHPRVYRNLGADGAGSWLGLLHEDGRIPQLQLSSGIDAFPNFQAVAAGDVNGDGAMDLYFTDRAEAVNYQMGDRLLINDGSGYFTDETAVHMQQSVMVESSYGLSVSIVDMNADGASDVVRCTGFGIVGTAVQVGISYNSITNPSAPGDFNLYQVAATNAPYHHSVGDLNLDGRLDLVVGNDGNDGYHLNEGNDGVNRVIWSEEYAFATDDGFAGNSLIEDLDGDGWGDVIIADVDNSIPGFARRLHLRHNRGGQVGGEVTILEETGSGFLGAHGLTAALLRCTHDLAVFDIDSDGDKDLVLARCEGTNVWLNQLDPGGKVIGTRYCNPAEPNSTGSPAFMTALGSTSVQDNNLTLTAHQLPANEFGYFLVSPIQDALVLPGLNMGTLCLASPIGRFNGQIGNSGSAGEFSTVVDLSMLPTPMGSLQVSPGETWNFTCWFRDGNSVGGTNFTDAISIDFE